MQFCQMKTILSDYSFKFTGILIIVLNNEGLLKLKTTGIELGCELKLF